MKKQKTAAAPSRAATPSGPDWITGIPADLSSAMLMEESLVRSLEKAAAGDGEPQATYKPNSRLTRCFKSFGVPDRAIPQLVEFVIFQGNNVDVLSQVALLAKAWRETHASAPAAPSTSTDPPAQDAILLSKAKRVFGFGTLKEFICFLDRHHIATQRPFTKDGRPNKRRRVVDPMAVIAAIGRDDAIMSNPRRVSQMKKRLAQAEINKKCEESAMALWMPR